MFTMLYDAETLKPQLLIEQEIKNGDIGKKFWVINGAWGGTFNGDSIVIHHPIYGDSVPSTIYKCYKFKSKPPEEYFELYEPYFDIACRRVEAACSQPDMFAVAS